MRREYGSAWERRFKVVFRFVVGAIFQERFVWNVEFVEGEVVNFKEKSFKDF